MSLGQREQPYTLHHMPRQDNVVIYAFNYILYKGAQSMTAVPDLIAGINLLLCVVVFLLGYLVYRKREQVSAILIGIAFGMFGISHFSVLAGIVFPEITFILLRIGGYILVAAALWLLLKE